MIGYTFLFKEFSQDFYILMPHQNVSWKVSSNRDHTERVFAMLYVCYVTKKIIQLFIS